MATLPQFQNDDTAFQLMQNRWAGILNPVVASPTNNMSLIKNVSLINGATVINHLLGRQMQGWVVTDINGAATIYRSAPMNDKTLTLTSNAAVMVQLAVF